MTDYQCEGWLSPRDQCTEIAIYAQERTKNGKLEGTMFLCKECNEYYRKDKTRQCKTIPIEQSRYYKK
jgi:hypothetical protein